MAGFRGDVMARARVARGLSQSQLARMLGVASPRRVVHWERGLEQPRARFVPEMAKLLDVSPFELLAAEPDSADLATLRTVRGLPAYQVARRLGVSVPTYSRLERGRPTEVTDAQLDALAELLGVSTTRVRALVARA